MATDSRDRDPSRSDGVTWTEPSQPPELRGENPNGQLVAGDGSWFLITDGSETAFAIWASKDGDTWTQLDVGALLPPGGGQSGGGGRIGNLFFFRTESGSQSHLWIIEFPPSI